MPLLVGRDKFVVLVKKPQHTLRLLLDWIATKLLFYPRMAA